MSTSYIPRPTPYISRPPTSGAAATTTTTPETEPQLEAQLSESDIAERLAFASADVEDMRALSDWWTDGWLRDVARPNSFISALMILEDGEEGGTAPTTSEAERNGIVHQAQELQRNVCRGTLYQSSLVDDERHTVDELAALLYYTRHGHESLNRVLRMNPRPHSSVTDRIAPMMRLLMDALRKFGERHYHLAQRGVQAANVEVLRRMIENPGKQLPTGKMLQLNGISSFSSDMRCSESFAAGIYSVIFSVRNLRAVPISMCSQYPSEQEVIPIPTAVFEVEGYNRLGTHLMVHLKHAVNESARHSMDGRCALTTSIGALPPRAVKSWISRDCTDTLEALLRRTFNAGGGRCVFVLQGGNGVGKSCSATMAVRSVMTREGAQNIPYDVLLFLDGTQLKQSLRSKLRTVRENQLGDKEPSTVDLWRWWIEEHRRTSSLHGAVAIVIDDLDEGSSSVADFLSILEATERIATTEHVIVTSHTAPTALQDDADSRVIDVGAATVDEVKAMLRATQVSFEDDESLERFLSLCNTLCDMQMFLIARLIDDLRTTAARSRELPSSSSSSSSTSSVILTRDASKAWLDSLPNRAEVLDTGGRSSQKYNFALSTLHDRLLRSLSPEASTWSHCLMELHAMLNTTSIPYFIAKTALEAISDAHSSEAFIDTLHTLALRSVTFSDEEGDGVEVLQTHEWHWKHLASSVDVSVRRDRVTAFVLAADVESGHPKRDAMRRSWLRVFLCLPIVELGDCEVVEAAVVKATAIALDVSLIGDMIQKLKADTSRVLPTVSSAWWWHSSLSELVLRSGDYAEALEYAQAALRCIESQGQTTTPMLSKELRKLGIVFYLLDQHESAITVCNRALSIDRLAGDDLSTATSLNNLAMPLHRLERYEEALQAHNEALTIRRAKNPCSRDVAQSLNYLAMLLHSMERYDEADRANRESLDMKRKVYEDKKHPAIAMTLQNMGCLASDLGRWQEAKVALEEALDIRRSKLSPTHPSIATTMHALAETLRCTGCFHKALQLHQEAYQLRRSQLPAGHLQIAASQNYVAVSMMMTDGRLYESLELLQQALETRRVAASKDGRWAPVAESLRDMALVHRQLGQFHDALTCADDALSHSGGTSQTSGVAAALCAKGCVLLDLGQYADALELLLRALSIRRQRLPVHHPSIATTLHYVGVALMRCARHKEAAVAEEEAMDIYDSAVSESELVMTWDDFLRCFT